MMNSGRVVSHTGVMTLSGLPLGGDLERALENVGVPSYVLDTNGGVRWMNAAAERLVGDVRGRHFSSVVAPEDSRRARELFARKVLGTVASVQAHVDRLTGSELQPVVEPCRRERRGHAVRPRSHTDGHRRRRGVVDRDLL